jgi:hypothetical protein
MSVYDSATDDQELAELESSMPAASHPSHAQGGAPGAVPSRFRRRLERFRGAATDSDGFGDPEDEAELKLQLVLLREENARLKAERSQPAGPGTAIDRMRVLSSSARAGDELDETFSLIGECLALREGLDQVCVEIGDALEAVRGRLDAIAQRAEAAVSETQDATRLRA